MRDTYSNQGAVLALAPAVQSASADGLAVDTKGYEGVTFAVNTGAIAGDGDFSVKLQESDASGSGFADADSSVVKSNAPATLEGSSAYKLGYTGFKRYVRVVITKAGGTSIAAGAVAILGNAHSRPVA